MGCEKALPRDFSLGHVTRSCWQNPIQRAFESMLFDTDSAAKIIAFVMVWERSPFHRVGFEHRRLTQRFARKRAAFAPLHQPAPFYATAMERRWRVSPRIAFALTERP